MKANGAASRPREEGKVTGTDRGFRGSGGCGLAVPGDLKIFGSRAISSGWEGVFAAQRLMTLDEGMVKQSAGQAGALALV